MIAVLVLAFVWRLACLVAVANAPLGLFHTWPESDMATFVAQAQRIEAGDLLIRRPFYPYHGWMRRVAKQEWDRWHPPTLLYQPPAYSYVIATLGAAGLDAAAAMRWIQLALGVASCGLVVLLGQRLLGRGAGIAAGAMLAVYGPLLVAESQLLRDGPIVFMMLLVLWLAVDTLTRLRHGLLSPGGWRWRSLVLGVLLGADATLHESALILAACVVGCGATLVAPRGGWQGAARWVALVVAGCLVGYAPLLVRNAITSAPLGPRFFGSALALATANHPDIPQVTADTVFTNALPRDPARFAALMRTAQGRVPSLFAGIIEAWGPAWPAWVGHWGRRILALSLAGESNENLCFAYFASRVPIVRVSATFGVLLPAAVAGVVALCGRRRRRLLQGPLGMVALQGVLVIGLVSLVHPFGRYRLMFLPLLAPLAGLGVWRIISVVRERRWREATALIVAGLAAAGFQATLPHVPPYDKVGRLRAAEYIVSADILLRKGDTAGALAELRDGLAVAPRDAALEYSVTVVQALVHHDAGDWDAAIAGYERALRLRPDDPLAREGLDAAYAHRRRTPLSPPAPR